MKAVNLLPEKHRPRQPTAGQGKGGYVVLGVLGALLIGVFVYVLTLNSINDAKTKIKEANTQAARLNAESDTLGAYGDFAKIKAQRVQSVMQLAQGRFDYERLVRELAQVLPSDVWLVNASASSVQSSNTGTPAPTPPAGGSGSSSSSSSSGGAGGAAAAATQSAPPSGPTLTLQGCARDQSQVAVTLVRLHELQGATDVTLEHSTRGEENTPGSGASAPATDTGSVSSGSCGTTHGKPNYAFQADVTFAPPSPQQPSVAPSRLGGGA